MPRRVPPRRARRAPPPAVPPIPLRELDGQFLRFIDPKQWQNVDMLAEADGVIFQCPKCAVGLERGEEGGRRFVKGAHSVICWFVGRVPDEAEPGPGRWTPSPESTGLDDLTFVNSPGRSSSVLLTLGCRWHGRVSEGKAGNWD